MTSQAGLGCAYEARVMQGIWAAKPYLHNGSVPTLAELLKPAQNRIASFPVVEDYDIEHVGLSTKQSRFNYAPNTTGCDELD